MSKPEIIAPPEATNIRLVDNEGNVILESEAIYIDTILSKAQEDVDVVEDDNAIEKWLPNFKAALGEKFGCNLGDTDAYFIAREATRIMWNLKKKFEQQLTSSTSTESTPSS